MNVTIRGKTVLREWLELVGLVLAVISAPAIGAYGVWLDVAYKRAIIDCAGRVK